MDEVGSASELGSKGSFGKTCSLCSIILVEVHHNVVPTKLGDLHLANSINEIVSAITGQALVVTLLVFAALEVGEACSLVDEVVGRALRAEAVGVDPALWVSQLAFSVRIEEVNPIAVHADT